MRWNGKIWPVYNKYGKILNFIKPTIFLEHWTNKKSLFFLVSSDRLQKAQAAESEASERCKRLTEELKAKEGVISEKDDLLGEVKKDSQRLDDELTAARKASNEAQAQVKQLETTVADLQRK